jgi:AraC-like DNA-binding protein
MDFRQAGPLRVCVVADATLPDPKRSPRILRIAEEVWQAGTRPHPRVDDVDRFVLVRGGRAISCDCDRAVPAGTVVMIPAGTPMMIAAAAEEDLALTIVTAKSPRFRNEVLLPRGRGAIVLQLESFSEAASLLGACLRHARARDELRQKTATFYFRTFLALLAAEMSSPRSVAAGRAATYQRARDFVATHALELESAGTAAARLGLSADYASRLFRQYAGEPLGSFLTRQKMSSAAERLRHGDGTIEEVAEWLGYSDRFSFTKAFTRHFGVTPGRWRRS